MYDWIGSRDDQPLYFTMHIEGRVIQFQDVITKEETLDLTGRVCYQSKAMHKILAMLDKNYNGPCYHDAHISKRSRAADE